MTQIITAKIDADLAERLQALSERMGSPIDHYVELGVRRVFADPRIPKIKFTTEGGRQAHDADLMPADWHRAIERKIADKVSLSEDEQAALWRENSLLRRRQAFVDTIAAYVPEPIEQPAPAVFENGVVAYAVTFDGPTGSRATYAAATNWHEAMSIRRNLNRLQRPWIVPLYGKEKGLGN